METGIYYDLAFGEYAKAPGMNCSTLKFAARSMLHLKAKLDGLIPDAASAALSFGTAFHTQILEPEKFGASVVVSPDADKRTKAGKALWTAFEATANGRTVIKQQDMTTLLTIAKHVAEHKRAASLMAREGKCEVSLF